MLKIYGSGGEGNGGRGAENLYCSSLCCVFVVKKDFCFSYV